MGFIAAHYVSEHSRYNALQVRNIYLKATMHTDGGEVGVLFSSGSTLVPPVAIQIGWLLLPCFRHIDYFASKAQHVARMLAMMIATTNRSCKPKGIIR
jgi:hypothetical protein